MNEVKGRRRERILAGCFTRSDEKGFGGTRKYLIMVQCRRREIKRTLSDLLSGSLPQDHAIDREYSIGNIKEE